MKKLNFKIEGMMCGACENRVKNALGNIEGVEKVTASYQTGEVTVTASYDISENGVKEILDDLGYKMIEE